MIRPLAVLGTLCALLLAGTADAGNVGFDIVQIPGPGGTSLRTALWYPATAQPAPFQVGPFTMDVADGAAVVGTNLPIVMISHGNGGSMAGHNDTAMALAEAGFVVAAVTHAGDNYRDHGRELDLQDRPPQISAALDYMLHRWTGHAAIDPARVGVFGFSAGGFTALALIGGKPDLGRVAPYCTTHQAGFICQLVDRHGGAPMVPANAFAADPRFKAAVIAAPGVGFTFQGGLSQVHVPVQLWGAGSDQILPVADNVALVRAGLPGSVEYHLVPNATHFDFLAPCPPALRDTPVICDEPTGFDRAAFHSQFDPAVVAFFEKTLAATP